MLFMLSIPFKLLTVLLIFCAPLSATAAGRILSEWRGEYFAKRQGALYLHVALKGIKGSSLKTGMATNIQITINNVLQDQDYILSHELQDVGTIPRRVWKLPSGKYVVKRIELVDESGVKRVWDNLKKRPFTVRRLCISNLGLWTLEPLGKKGLSAKFSMIPNSYKESGRAEDSSVLAVINGFNGLVQTKLGGKQLLAKARNDYESGRELRTGLVFTRQIAMFFKLDLTQNNHFAKPIAEVLTTFDPNLRACYTDRLDTNETLKGDVKFTFLLSKETQTMTKLRHTGGSADDPKLVECIYYELAKMQFPVSRNMLGEITYTFDAQ